MLTNTRFEEKMVWNIWIKTPTTESIWGQWLSVIVVSGAFFSTGMAMAWTSSAFLHIEQKTVNLTFEHSQMSLIAAFGFAGRFISCLPMSYLMDLLGRRNCLMIGRIIQLLHWAMLYFSYNIWVLYVARLFSGWYAGMTLFVIPVYISETVYKTRRGKAMGTLNILFLLGIVYESAVGAFTSYHTLILASGGLDFFLFLLMFMIPETPYYLLKCDKSEEALRILQWLRGSKEDVKNELILIEDRMKIELTHKSKYKDLFGVKSYRKAFIIAAILMIFQRLCGMTTMVTYASYLFPDTSWLSKKQGPMVLNLTYLAFIYFSSFFIDKWGRKKFLFLSNGGAGIFLGGCAVWYYLKYRTDMDLSGTEWIIVTFLLVQSVFASCGLFYIPPLVMSELFPMNVKAKASGLCTMFAVSASTTMVYLFLPISDSVGLYFNFILYSLSALTVSLYSTTIIETKGKSLEEIQDILEGK